MLENIVTNTLMLFENVVLVVLLSFPTGNKLLPPESQQIIIFWARANIVLVSVYEYFCGVTFLTKTSVVLTAAAPHTKQQSTRYGSRTAIGQPLDFFQIDMWANFFQPLLAPQLVKLHGLACHKFERPGKADLETVVHSVCIENQDACTTYLAYT